MQKECKICKKEFPKPINESKKNWEIRHIYCSKACMRLAKPTAYLVCMECSKCFSVENYRKNIAHFCSKECSWQYRDQGKRTADKKIRQSAKYKAWRTLVFERDNYKCVQCKMGGYLHADHIKPFALYPELRFEVSNGRTLCVPCHKKTPTYGRGAQFRNKRCVGTA